MGITLAVYSVFLVSNFPFYRHYNELGSSWLHMKDRINNFNF